MCHCISVVFAHMFTSLASYGPYLNVYSAVRHTNVVIPLERMMIAHKVAGNLTDVLQVFWTFDNGTMI